MGKRISLLLLVAFVVASLLVRAQEAKEEEKQGAPAETKGVVTKIFPIKHRDVDTLARLISAFRAEIKSSRELRVIAVTGRPEIVEAVAESIQRLDVAPPPPKNVELTFYIVIAMPKADQPTSIPPELEAVTKQLKGVFSYQAFRVLDTMILRCRDGQGAQASGAGPPPAGSSASGQITTIQVRVRTVSVTPGSAGPVIRLNGLKLGARVPLSIPGGGWQFFDTGFNTDIDVREGQKVVVGKANIDSSNDAMIAVVTAKVAD